MVTELRGQRRGVITSGDQLKTVYTCLISGASKLLSPGSADCEEVRESDDESVDLEIQQPQVRNEILLFINDPNLLQKFLIRSMFKWLCHLCHLFNGVL